MCAVWGARPVAAWQDSKDNTAEDNWLHEWSHLLNKDGALVFPRRARKARTSRRVLEFLRTQAEQVQPVDNSADVLVDAAPIWCPPPAERLEEPYGISHQHVTILGLS